METLSRTCNKTAPNSERRRALFPHFEDDDSDLGHISPLSTDSNSNTSDFTSSPNKQYFSYLNKNTIEDYVIIDKIKAKIVQKEADAVKNTVINNDDSNSLSPLNSSPMQALVSSPITSEKLLSKDAVVPCTPENDSPTVTLKTPQDAVNTDNKVPKLIRRSLLDASFTGDSESSKRKFISPIEYSGNKFQKLDNSFCKNSKVRTALFPEANGAVPVKSFYPKVEENNRTERIQSHVNDAPVPKKNYKPLPLYLCNRRMRNRRYFGEINAGVRHKIKKPKPKKAAKVRVLKTAVNLIENSSLVEYLETVGNFKGAKTGSTSENPLKIIPANKQEVVSVSRKRELSPPPDLNKKFFKSSRMVGVVTVNNIKLKVDHGKMSLIEKKKQRTVKRTTLDASDLMVHDDEFSISSEKIVDILNVLENSDKENESMNSRKILLTASTTVSGSENSILLHCEKNVCKPSMDVLLSPTSQMCDMTSELALNSPKKAKQNITMILENLPSETNVNDVNKIFPTADMEQKKLFPIFYGDNKVPQKELKVNKSVSNIKKWKPLSENQMLLDAGQKKFGLTQCSECSIMYHMGDAGDELLHLNYHNATNVLRFNGWKNENVVAQFGHARIIKIVPNDSKVWWKKVKELLRVVNRDLGYYESESNLENTLVFLYIKNRIITGCLCAEPKTNANQMLSSTSEIDMCSEANFPIKCGVSRIWVSQGYRKEGVGTSLMNCLRGNFMFGYILNNNDIAFSSPTEIGKKFARSYFKTPNYLVYTS